jgi:UDP-glucose 4-epimerase
MVARDFFYISDLVSAFMCVLESETQTRIFDIAGGQAYTLNELLAAMKEVTGKDITVSYAPGRKFDVLTNCLDISRAQKELGWRPRIALTERIRMTWEWLKTSKG